MTKSRISQTWKLFPWFESLMERASRSDLQLSLWAGAQRTHAVRCSSRRWDQKLTHFGGRYISKNIQNSFIQWSISIRCSWVWVFHKSCILTVDVAHTELCYIHHLYFFTCALFLPTLLREVLSSEKSAGEEFSLSARESIRDFLECLGIRQGCESTKNFIFSVLDLNACAGAACQSPSLFCSYRPYFSSFHASHYIWNWLCYAP